MRFVHKFKSHTYASHELKTNVIGKAISGFIKIKSGE